MTHTTDRCIKSAYKQYCRSCLYSLNDCYTNYSNRKEIAMDYCRRLKTEYHGIAGKIIGYNCMQFSYGFIGEIDGKTAFFYITKDYDRHIFEDELES